MDDDVDVIVAFYVVQANETGSVRVIAKVKGRVN